MNDLDSNIKSTSCEFSTSKLKETSIQKNQSLPCNSLYNKPMSGRCLCGSLQWTLPAQHAKVAQVLVCHCSRCRRISGSTQVPYAALSRKYLLQSLLEATSEQEENHHNNKKNNENLVMYNSTSVASRAFCKQCGTSMFMDYDEEHTLWVPIGTIDNFDHEKYLNKQRDSQIYLESKADYGEALGQLPFLNTFGTYRPDPVSHIENNISFDSLKRWDEVDNIADFVSMTEGDSESQTDATKYTSSDGKN
eukprot:CAMPEP_0184861834 /NCGR_PEP_ID=MMETSP0580-20130426/6432_1 /TAXON_ID=1118495 /ORGANISM="Dactyliosolen fragilissimus" /LENGTH=248 /DNA_ID=CAMNT_0027359475 /DNA_START=162 /DNA_END=908 /DNA_ORIENTATION=-